MKNYCALLLTLSSITPLYSVDFDSIHSKYSHTKNSNGDIVLDMSTVKKRPVKTDNSSPKHRVSLPKIISLETQVNKLQKEIAELKKESDSSANYIGGSLLLLGFAALSNALAK